MKSRWFTLGLSWVVVCGLAPAALAGAIGLIGPFSFSFFNSFLNNWFLFPFALGGCF